jgi:hypothetical protein
MFGRLVTCPIVSCLVVSCFLPTTTTHDRSPSSYCLRTPVCVQDMHRYPQAVVGECDCFTFRCFVSITQTTTWLPTSCLCTLACVQDMHRCPQAVVGECDHDGDHLNWSRSWPLPSLPTALSRSCPPFTLRQHFCPHEDDFDGSVLSLAYIQKLF